MTHRIQTCISCSLGIVISCFSFITFGQNTFRSDEKYLRIASRAMLLFQGEEYDRASLTYDTLFKYSKEKGTTTDLIVAAMTYSMTGDVDKAFKFLRSGLASYGKVDLENFQKEPNLLKLHDDKRWNSLIDEISARNERLEKKFNKPIASLLDSIYEKDQADRLAIDSVQEKYGRQSKELEILIRKIMKLDSSNIVVVKNIIERYGWLGPEEVGQQGASTIFLVIQHADSLTQVTYLPVMRDAVKKGKAEAHNLALLEDRVLVKQGKEQIYGSQLRTDSLGRNSFHPIRDEPNVNKRRAEVGLGPLEDYAKMFGIIYKLPPPTKARKKK